MQRFTFILFTMLLLFSCKSNKKETLPEDDIDFIPGVIIEDPVDQADPEGWKALIESDYFHLDVRYATENNFVGEPVYDCGKCFLRTDVANALIGVAKSLNQHGFKLVLFDCYRPKPVQQKLWDKVPNPNYVTPPDKGSMHNRGAAVDLSIMKQNGEYLDMGTEYDFFGEETHTDYMNHSEEVLKNRKLLNDLMVKYGFKGIRTEWWHFSFVDGTYEIADWVWDCD